MNVEIINTGNELLSGKIQNTNLDFLIKNLARLGARLTQVTIILDNLKVISDTLRAALEHNVEVIITTGGLGATYDDMTLAAVAEAIHRPLMLDERALEMVEAKFEYAKKLGWTNGAEISEHWKKMAVIPEGSIPLNNPPGAAPGVQIEYNGKTIFAMPGPPEELKAIFRTAVRPYLQTRIKTKPPEAHFYVLGVIEPTISGLIQEIFTKFKGVWIKSHPMLHTGKLALEIHITLQEGYNSAKLVENAKNYFMGLLKNIEKAKILTDLEVK
jgi:molybdenum cofactor synthesis domain-containing protein